MITINLRSGELTTAQKRKIKVINKMLKRIENYCSDLIEDNEITGIEQLSDLRSVVDDYEIKLIGN